MDGDMRILADAVNALPILLSFCFPVQASQCSG